MAARPDARRAALAGVALLIGVCACSAPPPASGPTQVQEAGSTVPAPLAAPDCATSVRSGPLPGWARDGFTGDGSSYRHVEGLRGAVVGVVFGYPLTSPPRRSRENKILWVARDPTAGRLHVDARLDGTGPVVPRDVGFGGGQSIIDLPSPGCWRLVLTWGEDVTDVVDLPYAGSRH